MDARNFQIRREDSARLIAAGHKKIGKVNSEARRLSPLLEISVTFTFCVRTNLPSSFI